MVECSADAGMDADLGASGAANGGASPFGSKLVPQVN